MKNIEKTGLIIVGLLIILRLIFGTGINVILMTMFVIVAIYYMWFGFFIFNNLRLKQLFSRQEHKRINWFKISTSIVMGLVYSFTLISIMFAILFYSNMNTMLCFSLFFILASGIFLVVYSKYNQLEKQFLYQFYMRSVIYGLICLFLWITPVEKKLNVLFDNHPEFVEAYKDYLENPDDPEVKEKLRKKGKYFR